jgi:phage terminase large subunit
LSEHVIDAKLPRAFVELFRPHRYKVAYGGRGSAKSWSYARALVALAAKSRLRILCAREFQGSIAESVHRLISDQIDALGLTWFFDIKLNGITGANGSEFIFEGVRTNITKIKSMEGIDICWVEEAENVSNNSWEVLIPTIRKEGSEIWVSFNPSVEDAPTHQRFVIRPPPNAWVVKVSWRDNPWFPDVLAAERDTLKANDEEAYLNIWEGECRRFLQGAYYGKELVRLDQEKRITRVPWEPALPVHTAWDLGIGDSTAIWCIQRVSREWRWIDYLENHSVGLDWYAKELKQKPYVYGEHILPHDAKVRELTSGITRVEFLSSHGIRGRVLPQQRLEDGVQALRNVLSQSWFDAENCAQGIKCLRHYRKEWDEDRKVFANKPLHDWTSHGADAARYMALGSPVSQSQRDARVIDEMIPLGIV